MEDTGIVPNRHGRRQRRERFGEFGRRVRRRRKTRLVIALYILLFFTLSVVGVVRSVSSEATSRSFDEEERYSAAEENGILSEPEFPALSAVTPVLNTTAFVFQDIAPLRFLDSDFVWEGDRLKYTGDEYDVRFGVDI
ncbi:MAG: hypothetical protein IJR48_05795, partial [Oscillibacter sp.]|nr:hypothetical protein [Oscillibacter sp.]